MRNFDFLKNEPDFKTLYGYCSTAEEWQLADPVKSASNCRKALECLVKEVYQINGFDYNVRASLLELLDDQRFKDFLGADSFELLRCLHYIRKIGNNAAHTDKVSKKESFFALLNLHTIVGSLLLNVGAIESVGKFNRALIPAVPESLFVVVPDKNSGEQPNEERKFYRKNFAKQGGAGPRVKPIEAINEVVSEAETRRLFIDMMLRESGWELVEKEGAIVAGKACIETEVSPMPNASGKGYVDYVLFGANGKPLALIEAKRTTKDPVVGRQQAKLYADGLERRYGTRPVVYTSNGYHTRVNDGIYPEREVYSFHTAKELTTLINRRDRAAITNLNIKNNITDRAYQKQGIKALCEHFNGNYRRGLLVMATGTGKTRTAISLVDVLARNSWVKNVLFLADRTALVAQAKKNFAKLLPSMSFCVLSEHDGQNAKKKKNLDARVMFSTYHTMMHYIDEETKQFGIGRFDLIILDEAHRSVFGKFNSIFDYFDSLLVGLTATPRAEIDRSTYRLFGLEDGMPNFAYELNEAVEDGYLVPYKAFDKGTGFMREGIKYAMLSEAEKAQLEAVWEYEATQAALKGEYAGAPRDIESKELNQYIYNEDTIDKVLQDLMANGQRVLDGTLLGKTIIFAANHKHAEMIVSRFGELFPNCGPDYCQLIDNYVNYAQTLIEQFEQRNKMPQVAVSVDMLDVGIDVPDILNLVFFKPVKSKIKFDQMIGRGTRLSPDIFGKGKDKKCFYIFDWCMNFE